MKIHFLFTALAYVTLCFSTARGQGRPKAEDYQILVNPGDQLQEVLSSAHDGSEILLAAGKYTAPAGGFMIEGKSRIMLMAQGEVVLETTEAASPVVTVNNGFNVVIQGLHLRQTGAASVIKVVDSKYLYLNDCHLQGGQHAMDVSETHVLRMHGGSAMQQSAAVFRLLNNRSISIRHVEISDNQNTAPADMPNQVLFSQDSDQTIFMNNRLHDNKNPTFAQISTGYFRVTENTFAGNSFPEPKENEPWSLVPKDEAAHFTQEFTAELSPEKKGEFMHLELQGRWQNVKGEWFDLVDNTGTKQLEVVPLSPRVRRLWTLAECRVEDARISMVCHDPAIEDPNGPETQLRGRINDTQSRIVWEAGKSVWERDPASPPTITEQDKAENHDNILQTESLGGIKLGMDDKALVKALGKSVIKKSKDITNAESGLVFQTWTCADKGLSFSMVTVDPRRKEIINITAMSKCRLSTLKGIKVGSSLEDVTNAYGKPERQGGPDDYLVGDTLNATGIFFTIKQGKVTQIFFGSAS